MKLEDLQNVERIDEGFRQKALAAIAAAGLTFGSFAKADTPDLYAYTDDNGETQVVLDYADVPKGKMAHVVKYEDVFGKMDMDEIERQIRANWKTKDALHRGSTKIQAPKDRLSRHMYRTDI